MKGCIFFALLFGLSLSSVSVTPPGTVSSTNAASTTTATEKSTTMITASTTNVTETSTNETSTTMTAASNPTPPETASLTPSASSATATEATSSANVTLPTTTTETSTMTTAASNPTSPEITSLTPSASSATATEATSSANVTLSTTATETSTMTTAASNPTSPETTSLTPSASSSTATETTSSTNVILSTTSTVTTKESSTAISGTTSQEVTSKEVDTSPGTPNATTPEVVTSTGTPNATTPDDICVTEPCGTNAATCINIQGGRICRCPYGYYYQTNMCTQGIQFFGTVQLTKPYSSDVNNPASPEYKTLYKEVKTFFGTCFENRTDYEETIITKISQFSSSKSFRKAVADPLTVIEVINIFTINSNITPGEVMEAIQKALKPDSLISNVTVSSPCNSPQCDEATTNCEETGSNTLVICTCKDGYHKRPGETTACTDCASDCTEKNFKECVQISKPQGLVPSCQCRADYQFDKEDKFCNPCDFGYTGKGCKDNFLLILVIVGSVGGAIVLALLGGVIGLSVKSKRNKKTPERERLIDHEENPVFGSGTSTNGNLFPKVRVKPTVDTNVPTMNPYTTDDPFQRTVPTRDYDDDNDSWFEMSSKGNRSGIQSKY